MQTEAAIKGRLDKDPWSVDLWESYVDLIAPQSAPAGPNVAKKRAVFEQLVTKFPTAVRLSSDNDIYITVCSSTGRPRLQ